MGLIRPLLKPRVAIIYQIKERPVRNGVRKPMKPGGYSDSGADIAYQLRQSEIDIITPVPNPAVENDFEWVFPDSAEGIQDALDKSATVFWLNTILYDGHPIESFFDKNVEFVGQLPSVVETHDDKFYTNKILREGGLSFPAATMITKDMEPEEFEFEYPLVLKPPLGRGSQGVVMVSNDSERKHRLSELFGSQKYGNVIYMERYFKGQEVTVTVMPPGSYMISGEMMTKEDPWCLPVVKRFNHVDGIAPYSGIVAVMENSCVIDDREQDSKEIKDLCLESSHVFSSTKAKAPIRLDARADKNGKYWIFDVNMKPNMTGPSRTHRLSQDSLSLIAAKRIGWDYGDFLVNILNQRWKFGK